MQAFRYIAVLRKKSKSAKNKGFLQFGAPVFDKKKRGAKWKITWYKALRRPLKAGRARIIAQES